MNWGQRKYILCYSTPYNEISLSTKKEMKYNIWHNMHALQNSILRESYLTQNTTTA